MTDHWERVQSLFGRARELPAAEREDFVRRECGDDAELRDEVLTLLSAADDVGDRLRPPTPTELTPALASAAGRAPVMLAPGTELDGFVVERLIATGGMGAVYEAEQTSPQRRVALKVLALGPSGERARQRFALESEVLARLDHEAIAAIHGAGVARVDTDDGPREVPWFAMELVEGATTILEHADGLSLDVPGRLERFLLVCDAVHHGHQRGVIHRDLKPANILVDRRGRPKVIDFGVALAAGDEALTVTGHVVGTLQYMSPEQLTVGGRDLDVRSDVYALGAVLFELLTGGRPYELGELGLLEAARVLGERPPRRPRQLRPELEADLEAVLLKALEKNPSRRYASVEALAADLRRWLRHEPVLARPPSATDQLRLFALRHRALVSSAAVITVVLMAATAISVSAALRAERAREKTEAALVRAAEGEEAARSAAERERAAAEEARINERQAREAEATALAAESEKSQLFDELFDFSARVVTELGEELQDVEGAGPVRQELLAAAQDRLERLEALKPGDPTVRGALVQTLFHRARVAGGLSGTTALGDWEEAARFVERGATLAEGLLAEGSLEVATLESVMQSLGLKAEAAMNAHEADLSERYLLRCLTLCELAPDIEDIAALRPIYEGMLGRVHSIRKQREAELEMHLASIRSFEEVIERWGGHPGRMSNYATSLGGAGAALGTLGRTDEALEMFEREDEVNRALLNEPEADLSARHGLMAGAYGRTEALRKVERWEEALHWWEVARERLEELTRLDPGNARLPNLAFVLMLERAKIHRGVGEWDHAEAVYRECERRLAAVPEGERWLRDFATEDIEEGLAACREARTEGSAASTDGETASPSTDAAATAAGAANPSTEGEDP